jgi:lysophospholipase L1-like esterase
LSRRFDASSAATPSIGLFGDSIVAQAYPWQIVQQRLITAGHPVQVANYAVSGQGHSDSWIAAQARIPTGGYKYAVWKVWSPNDGSLAADITADYNTYVPLFTALCQQYGVIPIILTSIPSSGINTGTDDAARLSTNTQAMALSGVIAVDMNSVMNDGATPQRQIPALTIDGVHPNINGQGLEGNLFATVLLNYINTH